MADLFLNQAGNFWEGPSGSVMAIVIVFAGMFFLMFYLTRGKTKEQLHLLNQIEQEKKKFKLLAGQLEGFGFIYQPEKDEFLLLKNKHDPKSKSSIGKEDVIIKDFSIEAEESAKLHFEDFKDFKFMVDELRRKKSGINQKYLLKKEYASSLQKYMEVRADYLPGQGKMQGVVVGSIWIKDKNSQEEDSIDKDSGLFLEEVFEKEASYALNNSIQGVKSAFLLVRISEYKQFMDNYSSDIPQKVDRRMGECIRKLFRENDIAGRISRDSYGILMSHITSREDIIKKTEDFQSILNKAHRESEGGTIRVVFGISFYPMDGENYEDLYNKALSALNAAGEEGKTVKCYE